MDSGCQILQQLHEQEFEEDDDDDFYYDSDAGESNNEDSASDSDTETAAITISSSPSTDDAGRRSMMSAYSVLSEKDIGKRQKDAIASVCAVLSIPNSEAAILLRNSEWSVTRVNDEWFADEDRFRQRVGLQLSELFINEPVVYNNTCGICLEDADQGEMIATSSCCGHSFCTSCWATLGEVAIADGPSCLSLRCPAPNCRAAVRFEDLILPLISEESRGKYKWYLMRSYVESNRKVKWCPAPGCEFAIEIENMVEAVQDVVCNCGHSFCWNCCEQPHKPVGCATVGKWMEKNTSESKNATWIMANSKPCPKCRRPIEKNHGCMHMTCSAPCKFEFCWLCLGDWSKHGVKTGGFYQCNIYQAQKKQGKYTEEERVRIEAKNNIDKYVHYYERWASNQKSMDKALHKLHSWQKSSGLIDRMRERLSLTSAEMKFISDAWLQIAECRRVLKWSYAYGYYIPEQDKAKKRFFEYLQGQAENALERLHMCAEQEIKPFTEELNEQQEGKIRLNEEMERSSFKKYRAKLRNLTSVNRNFFENLVKALENNLADVNNGPSTSKQEEEDDEEKKGYWSCRLCTFVNHVQSSLMSCSMCFLPADEEDH